MVWDRIASCLELKDFARLAATCKALASLQPECLVVLCTPTRHGRAILKTFTQHCRSVHRLLLSVGTLGAQDNMGLLNTAILAAQHMQSLVEARMCFKTAGCCPTLQNACLALLLGSSRGLQTLNVRMQKVVCAPPYCNLRHLLLGTAEGLTAQAAAELSRLTCLETLCLAKVGHGNIPTMRPDLVIGLDNLVNLRAVVLDGIVLQQVKLPASGCCLLHISGWGPASFQHCMREAGHISSVQVVLHEEHGVVNFQSIFGLACCNLTCLSLESWQDFGLPAQPISLQSGMCNLRQLSLQSPNIFLQISSDVRRLAELSLYAGERLWVGIENIGTFYTAMHTFKAQYTSSLGAGMPQLLVALHAASFTCDCSNMDMSGDMSGDSVTNIWCRASRGPQGATGVICGACAGCLACIGALTVKAGRPSCQIFK